jgi:hypothetical protein
MRIHAIANANENDSRLACGARIVPGAKKKKTTQKIYLQKPLTRAKILCYNFGAAKSNTFV